MSDSTTRIVLFDDCEYSDAAELLYQGEPYTGVVIEKERQGELISEQHNRHGILDGVSRGWYLTGILEAECDYAFGMRKYLREWYASGQMKRDIVYDGHGHAVSDRAWDEMGNAIESDAL